MNEWTKAHQAIRVQINPASPRRALLVEGPDDVAFVERQLDLRFSGWRTAWVVGAADGKNRVLDILALEPDWVGLVDHDEWDGNTIAQLAVNAPRLHVLPRYCMESYFAVPAELWEMLPPGQQAKIAGGQAEFASALMKPIEEWVRHGALWRIVNPLWGGLRARGFKEDLLQFPARDDAFIRAKFEEWQAYLDAGELYEAFENSHDHARGLDSVARLTRVVHGKSFFRAHVCTVLNGIFRPRSAADWIGELTKNTPAVDDLAPVWRAVPGYGVASEPISLGSKRWGYCWRNGQPRSPTSRAGYRLCGVGVS